MWNLKYDTNELNYETDSDREQTCGCQGGGGGGEGMRVWDEQMQTITWINKRDKQQWINKVLL